MKSSALQLFFKTERENCNQMVASVRHQSKLVKIDDLNWFLFNCLDPLMANFDGQSNSTTFPIALAGFKHGLELASLNWLKNENKKEIVFNAWNKFYNKNLNLVQATQGKIFSETNNLLSHLIGFGHEKPKKWLRLMSKISDKLDSPASLKHAGVVCAWMSGLAHFRKPALLKLEFLPSQTVRILFALSDSYNLEVYLEKLKLDRWQRDSRSPQDNPPTYTMETRIGQCQLLGGEFPSPPKAFAHDEQLFITSGELAWQLHADFFGSTLIPIDILELKKIPKASNKSTFSTFKNMAELQDLKEISSISNLKDTVALTSSETFSVIILGISNAYNSTAGIKNHAS